MKKICLMFVFFALSILQINVKAETCSNDEFNRLRNLADKVEFTYDYELIESEIDLEKYPFFTITAINLNKQLKVMIEDNYLLGKYKEFVDNGNGVGSIDNFDAGSKVTVTIRAYVDNDCSGRLLKTVTINIPFLNIQYYNNRDVCNEYPGFKYCKPFLDKKIDDYQFFQEFQKYVDELPIEKTNEVIEEKSNNLTIIILVIALIVIITLIILLLCWFIKKKRRESI